MKLLQRFSWILFGRLGGAVIQAVSVTLLARWIGPEQFGIFASAYGVSVIVQSVADIGISTYITKARAHDPASAEIRGLLRTASRVNTITSSALASGVIVWIVFDRRAVLILPLVLWTAAERQAETWLCIPLADGKTWQNATSLIFRRVVALLMLLASPSAHIDPLFGYGVGLLTGSAIAAACIQRSTTKYLTGGQRVPLLETYRKTRHFFSNSVATQARNLDTPVVALVLGPSLAGIYGAAARLTTPLRLIPTSFAAILLPEASRVPHSELRRLAKPLALLLSLTTAMYSIVALVLPPFVSPVLGNEYEGVEPVLRIVCISLIFASVASQLNSILQGIGHQSAVAKTSWIATAACILPIALTAHYLGPMGAALTLGFSYLLQCSILVLVLHRVIRKGINAYLH